MHGHALTSWPHLDFYRVLSASQEKMPACRALIVTQQGVSHTRVSTPIGVGLGLNGTHCFLWFQRDLLIHRWVIARETRCRRTFSWKVFQNSEENSSSISWLTICSLICNDLLVLSLVSTEIVASEVILAGVHYSNYLADFWYYFFKDINMFSPNIPARAGRQA